MALQSRTSDILLALTVSSQERVSVDDIVSILQNRAFALLVVLVGLPNCLPMPPPIPLICGFVLALLAIQIATGRASPWLPQTLLRRSIARSDLVKAIERAVPPLKKLEQWSRPRMDIFQTDIATRMVGFLLFILALSLICAAPFIGQIPLGIAVCLVGLGLFERDGIVVIGGLILGIMGTILSFGFLYALISGVDRFF